MFNFSKITMGKLLFIVIFIAFLITSFVSVYLIHYHMKEQVLFEAKEKAKILLDRNLATHHYFSHQLKPTIFKIFKDNNISAEFEPIWMSSTYAVREIDKVFKTLNGENYYYKEAAINARKTFNEADEYERDFILAINRDKNLTIKSEVRVIDNNRYFTILRRGETLEKGCLRCHDTPNRAPIGLTKIYGTKKSFNRSVGEVISAISIRIPIEKAYSKADKFATKISIVLIIFFFILFFTLYFLNKFLFLNPLYLLIKKVKEIASNKLHLGEKLSLSGSQELVEFTNSFNEVSKRLAKYQKFLQNTNKILEERVKKRTKELSKINRELSDNQRELRHIQLLAKIGNIEVNLQTRECTWSEEMYELFEIKKFSKVNYRTFISLITPNDREVVNNTIKKAIETKKIHECQFKLKKIDKFHYFLVEVELDKKLQPFKIHGVVQDITKQKELENIQKEQEKLLIEQAKLVSMSEMIVNISHHWRQPLSALGAIIQNIEDAYEFNELTKEGLNKYVEDSFSILESISHTISNFMNFFSYDSNKSYFSVKEAIRESIDILRDTLNYSRITINLNVKHDSTIFGYHKSYSQVILNILTNAKEVIEKSNSEKRFINIIVDMKNKQSIVIIEDSGGGIKLENITQIFEPYFTTKHKAQGTGISLYMCKIIIERNMSGELSVKNKKNGASFVIKV